MEKVSWLGVGRPGAFGSAQGEGQEAEKQPGFVGLLTYLEFGGPNAHSAPGQMEPEDPSEYRGVLKQAVLDYLNEHPNAMESVNGIAEWWIARRQIRVELEVLKRVLQELTESGVLQQIEIEGETYCRLSKRT